jgi:hypothetical protein
MAWNEIKGPSLYTFTMPIRTLFPMNVFVVIMNLSVISIYIYIHIHKRKNNFVKSRNIMNE